VGTRNHILDGGPSSRSLHVKGQFGWGRGPGHARTCPAVDILKTTHQGAEPVRCGYRLGLRTKWGAHWRYLANTIEPSVCGGDAAYSLCQIMVLRPLVVILDIGNRFLCVNP